MKTAVILSADSPTRLSPAGDIDRLLDGLGPGLEQEMWLLHGPVPPDAVPDLTPEINHIELIEVGQPSVTEACLDLLEQMFRQRPVDLALFGNDDLGTELAARLAFRLGGSACLEVEAIRPADEGLTVERSAYGQNMTARFALASPPFCLCPARSAGRPVGLRPLDDRAVRAEGLVQPEAPWLVDRTVGEPEAPTGLDRAEVVLAVGQGVGSRENLDQLENVARVLKAEIGVSRPVAMNGWAPMERLIGVSGRVLSPAVCLAAGVSGSGVFSYGIKNSGFIAAVNTDKNAPIFDQADVGLAEDMMAVLTALADLLEQEKTA